MSPRDERGRVTVSSAPSVWLREFAACFSTTASCALKVFVFGLGVSFQDAEERNGRSVMG
jgi:hypothetical protein